MYLSPFSRELIKLAADKAPVRPRMAYSGDKDLFVDPKKPEAGAFFFHGAPPELAESIGKKGLLPLEAKKHNMGYSVKTQQGFLGLFGLKEKKQLQRTSAQKASVHLTPYPHYAQAYGHFRPSGAWSPESHIYATYLTKKEMRSKLKVKRPEYSQAFGHRIASPALLHEGKVPANRLARYRVGEQRERDRRRRFEQVTKSRGRNPDDADQAMSNRLDRDLILVHKIPVVEED